MPPAYVKPYVKRQKNDAADAEAICEAVTRTNMRFVPIKTPEQQSGLMLHRTRHLFIRQQTSVINAIRAHLAEFGVTAAVGRKGIDELLRVIADPSDKRVPDVVRTCLAALGSQLLSLKKQILDFDRMIMAWHRSNQTSKRLNCIPGVGPLLATALVASVADPKTFRSGRNFSAWIGLVPKQRSSGGRDRLGSISKQGDRYLRSLFVASETLRLTRSDASAGRRSYCPPAERYSIATFWPSMKPVSLRPRRNAGTPSPYALNAAELRNSDHRHHRLLRVRRKRPHDGRTAERGYKLPPSNADRHLSPSPMGSWPAPMSGTVSCPNRQVCEPTPRWSDAQKARCFLAVRK